MTSKRRTQRERTELSRRKVIDATIACVQKGGVTNATVSKIAAEAGLTWGSIQHQFGSKGGVFAAVLESTSSDLMEKMHEITVVGKNLRDVVEQFTETLWSHYSQPAFRATLEILLNSSEDLEEMEGRVQNIGLEVIVLWREMIRSVGCDASDEVIGIAGEILETSVSGFAIRSQQFHQGRFNVSKHREQLVDATVYLLTRKG